VFFVFAARSTSVSRSRNEIDCIFSVSFADVSLPAITTDAFAVGGVTGSMERAIGETNRRREKQIAYNTKHGITPTTIKKRIHDIVGDITKARNRAIQELTNLDRSAFGGDIAKLLKEKRRQMHEAADRLDFETAALLRDEIRRLEEEKADKSDKPKKHNKDEKILSSTVPLKKSRKSRT
jgi:excinuclease UvrABC helicase subunit UvrB